MTKPLGFHACLNDFEQRKQDFDPPTNVKHPKKDGEPSPPPVEPFQFIPSAMHFFSSPWFAVAKGKRWTCPLPPEHAKNRRMATQIRVCFSPKFLIFSWMAEREGFEPRSRFTHNGFQDRRNRPLCHPPDDLAGA